MFFGYSSEHFIILMNSLSHNLSSMTLISEVSVGWVGGEQWPVLLYVHTWFILSVSRKKKGRYCCVKIVTILEATNAQIICSDSMHIGNMF